MAVAGSLTFAGDVSLCTAAFKSNVSVAIAATVGVVDADVEIACEAGSFVLSYTVTIAAGTPVAAADAARAMLDAEWATEAAAAATLQSRGVVDAPALEAVGPPALVAPPPLPPLASPPATAAPRPLNATEGDGEAFWAEWPAWAQPPSLWGIVGGGAAALVCLGACVGCAVCYCRARRRKRLRAAATHRTYRAARLSVGGKVNSRTYLTAGEGASVSGHQLEAGAAPAGGRAFLPAFPSSFSDATSPSRRSKPRKSRRTPTRESSAARLFQSHSFFKNEGTQEAATTSGRASAKTPSAKARDRHPSLAQCAGATSRASTYTGALLPGGGAAFPEPPRAPPGKGRSFGAGTPRQSTPLALDETQRRGSQLFSTGV